MLHFPGVWNFQKIPKPLKREYYYIDGMVYGGKSLESLKHEEKVRLCPDCGNEDLGFDKGESFCKKCGLVLD